MAGWSRHALNAVHGQHGIRTQQDHPLTKESINENDEVRKRFELMARDVIARFKSCVHIEGANARRGAVDAANVVYASLREGVDKTGIRHTIEALCGEVDQAVGTAGITNWSDAQEARPQGGPGLGTDPLARLEGFEPPTNGFGSHYSIRLSYRRVVKDFPPGAAGPHAAAAPSGARGPRWAVALEAATLSG